MARAKDKQDEDVAVDRYGAPLPTVKLKTKDGTEVEIHDAGSLTNLHYGQGLDFAEDGMSYASALAHLLGEDREQVLVEVPAEGGDVVWPGGVGASQTPADEGGKDKNTSKPGEKSG